MARKWSIMPTGHISAQRRERTVMAYFEHTCLERKRVRSSFLRTGIAVMALAIPAAAQRDPLFKTEILPVLEKNCVACHGEKQKMAKLDLSSFTGMMEGSSSGPVIAPGKPERSLMWKLIENDQMPQGGKLSTADKQLIKSYIQYGRFPAAVAETEEALRAKEAAKITA